MREAKLQGTVKHCNVTKTEKKNLKQIRFCVTHSLDHLAFILIHSIASSSLMLT